MESLEAEGGVEGGRANVHGLQHEVFHGEGIQLDTDKTHTVFDGGH